MSKVYLVLALILVLSTMGAAQQQTKSKNSSVNSSASGKGSASSKGGISHKNGNNGGTLSLDSATNITGELQSSLDAKHAQVGDEVILRTTKAIKQNGETIIPKGSNLIGHITDVQQRTKGNAESKLGLVFNRVEGKNLSADIMATVVSITNVQANNNVGDVLGSDVTGSSSTSASSSAHGSGGGGGLLGGSSGGGLLGGVGSTAGGVVNGATQTVGGVTNTAAGTLGSATQGIGQTINGIQISQSASGSANGSTTLSSQNKNVKLDKGVMFNLQLSGNANAN
jgi:Predicted membrane protein